MLLEGSAQPCGCDEGANHHCRRYPMCQAQGVVTNTGEGGALLQQPFPALPVGPIALPGPRVVLPTIDAARKACPVFTGFLMYFPLAALEVARVSKVGNDQHNPGQPMHWAREKSTDQLNTAQRHMMDHGMGNIKDDGGQTYHLAKAIWRLCAELQLTIEREQAQQRQMQAMHNIGGAVAGGQTR